MIKIKRYYPTIILTFIAFLGLYFRLSGDRFGLPDLIHPDEARIILDSMSMGQRLSPISEDINYPLFHKYFLLLSYGFYFIFGKIFGLFRDKSDFAIKFLQDPSTVIYISRVVTSIIGTLSIVAAYYWGILVSKSRKVGLLAALFMSLEWQLVFESQYAIHQTLSGFSSLLAFLGISLICIKRENKSYIFGGLCFGFAVASHQTAILLVPAILYLFVYDLFQRDCNKKQVLNNWIRFSIIAVLIGTMGNLNWIFRFKESLNFFLQGTGGGLVTFSSTPFFTYSIPSIIYWFFSELIVRDYFIGAFVLIAAVAAMIRRKKIDILYLIISITYFIFFYKWSLRWMHLFIGLLSISMLFAAKEFYGFISKQKIGNYFLIIISIIFIIPNIIDISKANQLKQQPETRQLARKWIIENIPFNSTIAVDYPAYAVSLPSVYPVMLRNRIAMQYFDTQLSKDVRDGFLNSLNENNTYRVIDMIDSKSYPIWPQDMPTEAVNVASKSATMKDIYAYFNFKPIDKLKNEGVQYIVLTSYTYGMALTNDDPRKVFLMNYYLKDNVIPFSYNSGKISKNTQHELMFYIVEREKNYFLQFLDNKIKGVKLIKEFYPNNNIGPEIKIYKVDK